MEFEMFGLPLFELPCLSRRCLSRAPEEPDVYGFIFLLASRSSGAQCAFGLFRYMPLLTERNSLTDGEL
jgi:hypothetical protein